jgi:hypothetical protein
MAAIDDLLSGAGEIHLLLIILVLDHFTEKSFH